jgi:hypothetical protein
LLISAHLSVRLRILTKVQLNEFDQFAIGLFHARKAARLVQSDRRIVQKDL